MIKLKNPIDTGPEGVLKKLIYPKKFEEFKKTKSENVTFSLFPNN
jgi:hypothetical protein